MVNKGTTEIGRKTVSELYLAIKNPLLNCESAKFWLSPEVWNKSRSVLFHIEVGKEDNGRVRGQENQNVPVEHCSLFFLMLTIKYEQVKNSINTFGKMYATKS